jgi:hypothetical protein
VLRKDERKSNPDVDQFRKLPQSFRELREEVRRRYRLSFREVEMLSDDGCEQKSVSPEEDRQLRRQILADLEKEWKPKPL